MKLLKDVTDVYTFNLLEHFQTNEVLTKKRLRKDTKWR